MKRLLGTAIIICFIPLLYFAQQAIIQEVHKNAHLKTTLAESIQLAEPTYSLPITMQDRNGETFSEIYVEWRQPLNLEDVPLFVQQLFLSSEDEEFYQHRGYNIAAIMRAFVVNSQTQNSAQGGSTITQQLIRMQYLTTEKTYERKVQEILYAAELEKKLSKNDILEAYLNQMYFGNRVYGIGSAATYYFNKSLHELNAAEMAFIAAIPNNPSLYDPLRNFDNTKSRQERLLKTMQEKDYLTVDEAEKLKNTPITLSVKTKTNKYPMYSDYVMKEVEQLIYSVDGFKKDADEAQTTETKVNVQQAFGEHFTTLLNEGLVIETALWPEKQAQDNHRLDLFLQHQLYQAGGAVIENDTREIVSLYGGKNYAANEFHRGFQAYRQPASAIKPLLVYAPLFETTRFSSKTAINSGPICIEKYCPKNVGGFVYGTTTIEQAFRHSHNTAAVRLFQQVGINQAFQYMKPFQFKKVSAQDYHYAAALGGFNEGLTPLELASAYTSFIDGTYRAPHAVRAIKNKDGELLYEWPDTSEQVWSESTVREIRHLLADVVRNGTGKGIHSSSAYTGAKTGTADSHKDLWVAGLNDRFTATIWLGYDTPASIESASKQNKHLQAFNILIAEP